MSKGRSILLALACFLTALFFISWAMQTVWMATFPDCNCPEFAYYFYLQLLACLSLLVAGAVMLWRALRGHRKSEPEASEDQR